jgi:hypothetical protein
MNDDMIALIDLIWLCYWVHLHIFYNFLNFIIISVIFLRQRFIFIAWIIYFYLFFIYYKIFQVYLMLNKQYVFYIFYIFFVTFYIFLFHHQIILWKLFLRYKIVKFVIFRSCLINFVKVLLIFYIDVILKEDRKLITAIFVIL